MDSDEDDEFSFGQEQDRHGGKLNEILSEVETKIPSLEFDDYDEEEDIAIWAPPDNVPSFYRQFTSSLSPKDVVEVKVKIQNEKEISGTFCETDDKPPNNETDCPSDKLQNKMENKSTSTVNSSDKKTIATLHYPSTHTSCQTDDSNLDFLDNHSPISSDSRTSNANVPRDLHFLAGQPEDCGSYVQEQKPPIHTAGMEEVNLEITDALSLTLRELENDQGNKSDHTRGFHAALYDTNSLVSTKSLACQTDVQSFQFVNLDASTISCQTDNHVSSNQPSLCTARSSENVFCVPIDEEIPTAGSMHSSVSCQTDQSNHEHHTGKISKKEIDCNSPVDKQISISTASCQTERNYSENRRRDESVRVIDSVDRNTETDEVIRVPEHSVEMEKLDFNLLNEINFSELKSVLGTLPSMQVSDILTSNSREDGDSRHTSDDELMLKLSDLSRGQLSACSSVVDDKEDNVAESIYQKKRKVKANHGSAKAIHTWSQLNSDDSSTKEPQTVFLDLRPDTNSEKEKKEDEYSESIQRILGLNKERSDSISDDGSDDDFTEWHEMRTKLKERAKQELKDLVKSSQTHADEWSGNPTSPRKGKISASLREISGGTAERLSEEELTGGLPLGTCKKTNGLAYPTIGDVQKFREANADVQSVAEESNRSDTSVNAEAGVCSGSKIAEHGQGNECTSNKKIRDQGVVRAMTGDEYFADMKLNRKKETAKKDHSSDVAHQVENSYTFPGSIKTVHPVDVCGPLGGKEDIFHNHNVEHSSAFDSREDENRSENDLVECNEEENNIYTHQRKGDKGLDTSSSNGFIFKDKMCIQLDERSASYNKKNEVKEHGNTASPADIRISLIFSRTEGKKARVEMESQDRALSTRRKDSKYRKMEDLADSRGLKISSGNLEKYQYRTNMEACKTILEPKTDTSIPLTVEYVNKEEKTSIMNGLDVCENQKIRNYVEEEKAKQSLISTDKTTPPNSRHNKERNKNKVEMRSASSQTGTKQQKQRSQKELKKLKEKLRINLENMRPIVTASGKYAAAYNTPIIYDQDASFEPEQRGLMAATEDELSLLLVVTLSGCGEINNQHFKGRTLGQGSEVNYYYALLSWLLYLCDVNNNEDSVPFTVVGMHQACQNGLLQLVVAVQPHEKVFYQNASNVSQKTKTRTFHKAVSKYLSTHSLRGVYQSMEHVYLDGTRQVDENSYSSKMLSTCITVKQDSDAVRRVFRSKPGFFWETMELESTSDFFQDSDSGDVNVENTIVFVRAPLYYHPSCVLDLLTRIENEGCDVAGLRLTSEPDSSGPVYDNRGHEILQSRYGQQPTFAVAIRGPFAITKIKHIIGSKIPSLDDARRIHSLRSLYCSTNTEDKLFYCPSYSNQALAQLARVFGGRLTVDDIEAGSKSKPCSPDSALAQKPPALLVSSTRVAFHLVISPLVPPSFFGELLHTCTLRGFALRGIRRVQLSKRQGTSLGFSQLQFHVFCPSSANTPVQSPGGSPPGSPARRKSNLSLETMLALTKTISSHPSTILILQKENGLYHAASLVKHLFESLKDWMTTNPTSLPDLEEATPRIYLCTTQFNEVSSKSLWGDVCYKPDTSLIKRARNNRFSLSSEVEQVCVLSSADKEAIQHVGVLLKKLTNSNYIAGDWELLGLKSFPNLSLVQAREVTPYEIGDRSWVGSVKMLMSAAVFVCVLRGINIIRRVLDFITALGKMSTKEDVCLHKGWWLSQTTEVAYRQLTVLFEESELFSDERNRTSTKFVPPLYQRLLQRSTQKESKEKLQKHRRRLFDHKACSTDESSTSVETAQFTEVPIIQSLLVAPRPLTTIALIKPLCVANTKKISKIFKSILQENFSIVSLNMRVLTQSEAQVLARGDEPDYNDHIKYLTSGASLVICLQRENAVKKLLDIIGPEDPVIARSLDSFLLRGCYGVNSIHNAVHGSESYNAAICELKMLFPCGVCCEQTIDLEAEQIPSRVFDATISKKSGWKLTKCLTSSSDAAHSLISSLVQVNCVILTHHVVYGRNDRKRIALVDVLECLFSNNFVLVGMKMGMLSREQVDELLTMVSSNLEGKQDLERELAEEPCIILALQRENAITCFDSIIESAAGRRRSITEYRKHIVQANSEEEARNLLMYFFDGLAQNSVQQICRV